MLLLHNTIPLICCLVEKTILPLQEFWGIYPADAWLHSAAAESCSAAGNPISQARDPILRPQDPILLAPAGAESHFAESWNCLLEYKWKWFFWRILRGYQISGYASFCYLEAPYWSLQNFFCPQHSQFSFWDKWYICSVYTIYFIN